MLSLTLSFHWAVLQSVAWTTMLVERLRTQSVTSAFSTTFDGKHPCQLCLVIRDGRTGNTKETVPISRLVKLDGWVSLEAVPVVFGTDGVDIAYPPVYQALSRLYRPPLPPPRSA